MVEPVIALHAQQNQLIGALQLHLVVGCGYCSLPAPRHFATAEAL